MFTGIVEEVGSVASVPGGSLVVAASKVLKGMQPGGSIAVNGVCLTVTDFDSESFSADVMPETLRKTNLGLLRNGDMVNLERPTALGEQKAEQLDDQKESVTPAQNEDRRGSLPTANDGIELHKSPHCQGSNHDEIGRCEDGVAHS